MGQSQPDLGILEGRHVQEGTVSLGMRGERSKDGIAGWPYLCMGYVEAGGSKVGAKIGVEGFDIDFPNIDGLELNESPSLVDSLIGRGLAYPL